MTPIIDTHLDLSMNAIGFDRDLCLPVAEINRREQHMKDHPARGKATVSFPQMRSGGVVLAMGTLLARSSPNGFPTGGYKRVDIDFVSPLHASAFAAGQIDYYHQLEKAGEIAIIQSKVDLDEFWERVEGKNGAFGHLPIGIIIAMEGSDAIAHPFQAERWWERGLRVASLVHYGQGVYAAGTGLSGPVTDAGKTLLKEFNRLGMILDVSHLCDQAFYEAIDLFDGPIVASHNNCRALVDGSRQFSDEQIKLLIEKNGAIGVTLGAWMLDPKWIRWKSDPRTLSIASVVDHIDHICNLAGNAGHVGIGSDLDGGFGTDQTPGDVKTIADLQLIGVHLRNRGYAEQDIDAILNGNWLSFLREHLPD